MCSFFLKKDFFLAITEVSLKQPHEECGEEKDDISRNISKQ